MIRKLLFALAVLLTAGLASAQPNLNYSFARDNQGVPIIGRGLRPTVTGEMGIPIGTPFYDTSTFSLYYWGGSAWTASGMSGGTSTGPLFLPDGTAAAPSLAFTSDNDTGIYLSGANTFAISANGVIKFGVDSGGNYSLYNSAGEPRTYIPNAGTFRLASLGAFQWSNSATNASATIDLSLERDATATLQMGTDVASAVSQTFKGSDSTGNGTAGGVLTIRGGAGTAGDAKGGNLNLAGGAAFGAGEQGVVAIVDTGTKPTCVAGLRGGFWYEQGGAGVADTFEVCAKAGAGDTYAWRTLATIP